MSACLRRVVPESRFRPLTNGCRSRRRCIARPLRDADMVSEPTRPKPSFLLALLKWPAICTIVAFVASEVFTDSSLFLQWVWFVPRPLLAGAALAWALLAVAVVRACGARRPEMRGLLVVAALSLACLAFGLLRMWGFPKDRPTEGLRIVHWNASYPADEDIRPGVVDALFDLDADIIVLTDAGQLATGERALRALAAGYEVYRPGRFAVLSRLPVLEATPIAAAKRGSASRIRIGTKWGDISIRAIDLPSDPRVSRTENSRALASAIAAVDASSPDILVGDFNVPGGSGSLESFGRGYLDAFGEAGVGWGGTYPAGTPMWRIDLTLVRPPWEALRSEIVDLNGRRHRAQVVDLRRRDGE